MSDRAWELAPFVILALGVVLATLCVLDLSGAI
jgi:hypothetical protein